MIFILRSAGYSSLRAHRSGSFFPPPGLAGSQAIISDLSPESFARYSRLRHLHLLLLLRIALQGT